MPGQFAGGVSNMAQCKAATASGGSTNTNNEAYWQQLPGEICVKPSFSTEHQINSPRQSGKISAICPRISSSTRT